MIKKTTPLILLSLILASCSLNGTSPVSLNRHYHKMLPAIVAIDYNGRLYGSGTVIDKENGFILTANHVVQGETSFEIRFLNGLAIPATVYAQDESCDSAILKVEPYHLAFFDIPKIKFQKCPRIGNQIFAIGHPYGLEAIITEGLLSRSIIFPDDYWSKIELGVYLSDLKGGPGSSGCSVYNFECELIGILVGCTGGRGGDFIPVIIPASSIIRFFEANNIRIN